MALQTSSPSSSFTQQGTIDWVQLSSTTVSASLDVFARLSAANIHTMTLMVGQALATNFKLSLKGLFNAITSFNLNSLARTKVTQY